MNIKKYVLVLFVMFFVPVTWAECLTQSSAIMFVQGVQLDSSAASKSRNKLEEVVLKSPEANPDCLSFDYVPNADGAVNDALMAVIQKAQEQGFNITQFLKLLFLAQPYVSAVRFDSLIDEWTGSDAVAQALRTVLGDQVESHLAKYREHLGQGRQLILVPHSQGNEYANEEWSRMTPEERQRTHIVAVSTPADNVADNGPYTTLTDDGIARIFFLGALPANASNQETCDKGNWYCHAFAESYMAGQTSRNKIVGDIVALLPRPGATIEGTVRYDSSCEGCPPAASGATVLLRDVSGSDWIDILSVTADGDGHYRMTDIRPCTQCRIDAQGNGYWFGNAVFNISPGEHIVRDITLRLIAPW